MKFTVIITNNTKYSIYVYICLFLRKFYSETNKSKQSWMLIQIQMYVRCGNRGHTVSTTIHGGNIFFPHYCWVCNKILHCRAFQSLQFMNYCNKFPVLTVWHRMSNAKQQYYKIRFLASLFFYLLKTRWCNSIKQMEKEEEKFSLPKHWVITSYHMPYQLDTFAFLFLGSSEVGELRFLLIGILK